MMKIQLRIGYYAVLKHRLHSPAKRSNCFNLTWNHSSRTDTIFFNSICFSFHSRVSRISIHPRMYALRSFRFQPSRRSARDFESLWNQEQSSQCCGYNESTLFANALKKAWVALECASTKQFRFDDDDVIMWMWCINYWHMLTTTWLLNNPLLSPFAVLRFNDFKVLDWTNFHDVVLIVVTSAYHSIEIHSQLNDFPKPADSLV